MYYQPSTCPLYVFGDVKLLSFLPFNVVQGDEAINMKLYSHVEVVREMTLLGEETPVPMTNATIIEIPI